jgi:homoserine kinase
VLAELKVTVEAPASSANLGPGFDVFALAFDRPRDRITLRSESAKKLSVSIENMGDIKTPEVAARNGAGAVCVAIARNFGIRKRIAVEIAKGVPIGQGLGSSGASAAAAAFGMNELFGLGMSGDDMVFYAGKGEEVTAGAAHYDNVSASVMGGFVVVKVNGRPSVIRYDPPADLVLVLVTPVLRLPERKTEYTRSVLPKAVALNMMVSNVANASLIVSGFARGDITMIGSGMRDKVVEEARKKLIPGYDSVKKHALEAGAAGVCISGAGPSMLAVLDRSKQDARAVMDNMVAGFGEAGIESDGFVTKVGGGAVKL